MVHIFYLNYSTERASLARTVHNIYEDHMAKKKNLPYGPHIYYVRYVPVQHVMCSN